MYRMASMKLVCLLLLWGAVLSCGARTAAADDEGEWATIGADVADMVADNLLSWIEGPLAQHGLTTQDDPGLDQPDPNTPVIVIVFYVDAPLPASNKSVIVEIYPDKRVKITTGLAC